MAETRCVNDTNGDGDCAQCARNPQAPCRQAKHLTECAVRMYPNERYPCTCRDYSPEW